MDIKAILFDCDGTLVDSESITSRILVSMIGELGLHLSPHDFDAQYVGGNIFEILDDVESQLGRKIDRNLFIKSYRIRCEDAFVHEIKPVYGMVSLVENLRVPFCVASNGPKEKMATTLRVAGFQHIIPDELVYSAYDIQKWKPEPDLFLYAAQQLGVHPSECLVVEDSVHGIRGALSAHMHVVGIAIRHNRVLVESMDIPIFENGIDLGQWLRGLGVIM